MMRDRKLGNPGTHIPGQSRNKPVHFPVQLEALCHLTAKCLERTAIIVQFDLRRERDHMIGDLRRETPVQKRVLSIHPPAVHQVISLVQLCQQTRDIDGVILEVTIQRNNDVTLGILKSCGQGRGLAEDCAESGEP